MIDHRGAVKQNSPGALALGQIMPNEPPCKGVRRLGVSIPNIAFIEGDPVAFEDFTNLFLIAKFFMMFGLVEDIGRNSFHIRLAGLFCRTRRGGLGTNRSIIPIQARCAWLPSFSPSGTTII